MAPGYGDTAAWRSRVACVYQRSMVVPELTVAENLFLNRFPGGKRIHWSALRAAPATCWPSTGSRWTRRAAPRT